MPVGIKNKSSETRGPSKYQNSLISDNPFVSWKFLIFYNFSSPLSPPDGRIGENELIKSICLGPCHANQFSSSQHAQKHQTRQSIGAPSLTPPKECKSSPVTSVTYLRYLLILPTKFHSDLSTLSVFQDFRFPLLTSPNITRSRRDLM